MAYLAYLVLLVLLTAIERTWPGWLLIYDQGPQLVAAAIISAGLCAGPVAGCFAGLIGALLLTLVRRWGAVKARCCSVAPRARGWAARSSRIWHWVR